MSVAIENNGFVLLLAKDVPPSPSIAMFDVNRKFSRAVMSQIRSPSTTEALSASPPTIKSFQSSLYSQLDKTLLNTRINQRKSTETQDVQDTKTAYDEWLP